MTPQDVRLNVHDGVWVAADGEFAVRLARYCARNPVALSRLAYPSDNATVTYHSDKPTGPTAGSETVEVLEFQGARGEPHSQQGPSAPAGQGPSAPALLWLVRQPDLRGIRRRAGAHEQPPAVEAESVPPSLPEARRRWAELLRRI